MDLISKINDPSNIYAQIIRFVISGFVATLSNLIVLYVLTGLLGVWYVISVSISFIAAFGISFFLQKYWTFRDNSRHNVHIQSTLYFIVAAINLFLNTYLVYVSTDIFSIYYIYSQIIVSAVIAVESYFIYRAIFGLSHRNTPQT